MIWKRQRTIDYFIFRTNFRCLQKVENKKDTYLNKYGRSASFIGYKININQSPDKLENFRKIAVFLIFFMYVNFFSYLALLSSKIGKINFTLHSFG